MPQKTNEEVVNVDVDGDMAKDRMKQRKKRFVDPLLQEIKL